MTTIVTIFGFTVFLIFFAAKTRNKTFHITQIGEEFFIIETHYWLSFSTSYTIHGEDVDNQEGYLIFKEAQRALKRLKKGKKI